MADMLVMVPEHVPHKDGPDAWKSGMVVDIFPDGRLGPATDQHPRFFIIRIPGASVEDVYDLLEPEIHPVSREQLHHKAMYFDFDSVPNPFRDAIDTDREITMANVNTLRSWTRLSSGRS